MIQFNFPRVFFGNAGFDDSRFWLEDLAGIRGARSFALWASLFGLTKVSE